MITIPNFFILFSWVGVFIFVQISFHMYFLELAY